MWAMPSRRRTTFPTLSSPASNRRPCASLSCLTGIIAGLPLGRQLGSTSPQNPNVGNYRFFPGFVLQVDHDRWGQTQTDLRELALNARHARSRERFLALHEIAEGACATHVAMRTGRHPQPVTGCLHVDKVHGPAALTYQRIGCIPAFVPISL